MSRRFGFLKQENFRETPDEKFKKKLAKTRIKHNHLYRKIASDKIERTLNTGEVVHHIDTDRANDSPGNLIVVSDTKAHWNLHGSLDEAARRLVKMGVIGFDENRMKYYINTDKINANGGESRIYCDKTSTAYNIEVVWPEIKNGRNA